MLHPLNKGWATPYLHGPLHESRSNNSTLQVRAAEDILSLTRILKESWLFGKLETVGISDAENRAEEAARKVAEGLSKLQGEKEEKEPRSSRDEPDVSNADVEAADQREGTS